MPRRRAGRAVRTVGRTAVVAGTATAVSGRVSRRQQEKAMEEQEAYYAQQAAAAPPPAPAAPAPAAGGDDDVAQIRKLAELRDQGILTDEEFAAKKAQILGI